MLKNKYLILILMLLLMLMFPSPLLNYSSDGAPGLNQALSLSSRLSEARPNFQRKFRRAKRVERSHTYLPDGWYCFF